RPSGSGRTRHGDAWRSSCANSPESRSNRSFAVESISSRRSRKWLAMTSRSIPIVRTSPSILQLAYEGNHFGRRSRAGFHPERYGRGVARHRSWATGPSVLPSWRGSLVSLVNDSSLAELVHAFVGGQRSFAESFTPRDHRPPLRPARPVWPEHLSGQLFFVEP